MPRNSYAGRIRYDPHALMEIENYSEKLRKEQKVSTAAALYIASMLLTSHKMLPCLSHDNDYTGTGKSNENNGVRRFNTPTLSSSNRVNGRRRQRMLEVDRDCTIIKKTIVTDQSIDRYTCSSVLGN